MEEDSSVETDFGIDEEQYNLLVRSVDDWNKWKEEHPNTEIRLNFADFENVKLNDANLQNAQLAFANLQNSDLSDSSLQNANLAGAKLQNATLVGANLQNAHLTEAKLNGAKLREAQLQNASLRKADLTQAKFFEANLQGAKLNDAKLQNSIFEQANLQRAHLKGCELKGANLFGADLRNSHLSNAKDYIFDVTNIRDVNFSNVPNDPWTILRRKYTGPAMLWTFVALIGASIPLVVKALYWSALNLYQEQQLGETIDNVTHDRYTVLSLVLGIDKGFPYFTIPILLIIYNILRGILTFQLSPMRDLQESTGYTPPWIAQKFQGRDEVKDFLWILKGYRPLFWLHKIVEAIGYVAITFFIYNLWYWLSQDVWIPKVRF